MRLSNLVCTFAVAADAGMGMPMDHGLRSAADCHFKMPGVELRGAGPLVEMLRAYRVAFPDLRHEVLEFVESGETIAIELVVRGTRAPEPRPPALEQTLGVGATEPARGLQHLPNEGST